MNDTATQAPGDLAMVEAFLNTITYNWDDPADEELTDLPSLERWLRDHHLLSDPAELRAADLERAIAVREALRELAYANHDGVSPPADALTVLEEQSSLSRMALTFSQEGHASLDPTGSGFDRVIGAMLAVVFHSMHDGTWQRLKACRNDGCRYAFYDTSRNRSGRWCDMAVCGNRAKVRAFRERQRRDQGHE